MINFNWLSKRELEIINRKNFKYPLAIAEKDYFLTIVSKIIYNSLLESILVFKGGTALHHCYLNQMRFSEDLDFTSLDKNLTIEKVKGTFVPYKFLRIKREYVSDATIKIERLIYEGPLGQTNSLKLEIDCWQNVVLPAKEIEYKNKWKISTKVNVMDIREIAAEKIRATSDRARYRDFYDLFQIFKNYNINLNEIIDLIKQKEIRKPISQNLMLSNWQVARQDKKGELQRIYYSKKVEDLEMQKFIKQMKIGSIDNRL